MSVYSWQQQQWQQLQEQRQQNRLPHALLLTGQSGLGKTEFAYQLAQGVLCDTPTDTGSACAHCRSCELWAAHSHPDFYPITIEEKSKSIKVDQLRLLNNKVVETANRQGYQVVIIHPADTMNRAAANALLKTLEEPQGDVLFLLVCNQVGNLPATILSRCQKIAFSAQEETETVAWLNEQTPSEVDAAFLLRLADHAPLRAQAMIEQDYLSVRDSVLKHLGGCIKNSAHIVTASTELAKQDPKLIISIMLSLTVDLIKIHVNADVSRVNNSDRLDYLKKVAAHRSQQHCLAYLQQVEKALRLLQGSTNPNIQLLLESLLVNWSQVTQEASL